jgi:hypothetical protein
MTRTRIATIFAFAAVAAALATAAPASAKFTSAVADCNAHARLTEHYTPAELKLALNTMPSDVKEYTDCFDVINRAYLAAIGEIRTGAPASAGTGGSSFLPTPLLILLGVLIVAAAGFGLVALWRRGSDSG